MKRIFCLLTILVLFFVSYSYSQSMKEMGEETKVYIANDVKLAAAQNNTTQTTTGTGTLGILYRSKYLYGNVAFNVINKNEKLSTADSSEVKLFSNNLLIPENSGQGISSFYISLGWKSFSHYTDEDDWSNVRFLAWKRIGLFLTWQANNTIWTKDTISTSIHISSPGIYATYSMLNLELENEGKDKVYLSAFAGFQGRFLGGDYGLDGNEKIRAYFLHLKKDKVNFIATTFGIKLEFGKFFGKIQETYVWGKDNIPGFSGWQAVISLGANIDLNIPAKTTKPLIK